MKIFPAGLLLMTILISCSDKNKDDIATITGTISNPKSEFVFITISDSLIKTKLDKANNFELEVRLKKGGYFRFDHGEHTMLYLKPNKDLYIDLDANKFDESIKFSGSLGKLNNYLSMNIIDNNTLKKLCREKYYSYKKELYNSLIDSIAVTRQARLKECTDEQDSLFLKSEANSIYELKKFYTANYDKMNLISKGKPAPEFISEDINGNRIYISKYHNNYKIIDVWATWCVGCKKERPFFEKLAQKYKNKGMVFISLSVDEDKEIWEKFIKENDSGNIQLWIPNVMNSDFVNNYNIPECGVPLFIIIDKENKIVNSRAPGPSENLEEILLSLL